MLARRADPLVIVMRPRQQTRTNTTRGVRRPWDRDSWAAVIGGNKMTPNGATNLYVHFTRCCTTNRFAFWAHS